MNGQSYVTGSLVGDLRACANGLDLYASAADRIVELEVALREIGEGWDGVPGYNRPAPEDQIATLQSIARTTLSP